MRPVTAFLQSPGVAVWVGKGGKNWRADIFRSVRLRVRGNRCFNASGRRRWRFASLRQLPNRSDNRDNGGTDTPRDAAKRIAGDAIDRERARTREGDA